jgi:5-methylcytosine-specific restriction protein B
VISSEDAIATARRQRDELLAGDSVLATLDASETSDEVYKRLQDEMERVAPGLSRDGWAHKYWFLIHPDRLDDFHSPRWQRFHLLKLLEMPPDRVGILDGGAPRFICAGRFVTAARVLGVPVTALTAVLNHRAAFHQYWRVGTREGYSQGDSGESQWAVMRDGGFVSIGWPKEVPDLSPVIGQNDAKNWIRERLLAADPTKPGVATSKAGEILNFAQQIAENDLVLACDGQKVLGVGRVVGSYEYDGDLRFPHKRPVEWLLLDPWAQPEGLLHTVWQLGKSAENLLELERRLFGRTDRGEKGEASKPGEPAESTAALLPPPLDPIAARIESILRRKGQVVLYGPPGTGKTYHAIRVAKELAARDSLNTSFEALAQREQAEIANASGSVRLCTFHPGFGYEDFLEGLRPRTVDGQMLFEPRDGIFKRLCADAARQRNRKFFLVIDEINRGDVPRIFGELITIIELDKRDRPITLPVTGSSFSVPPNVFLIGTMNTADRSITLLDAALRRRFGFVELMPDTSLLESRKAGELPLGLWLDALNARLRKYLKRDARNLQIGHAYLMPRPPITSVAEFVRVLRDDIIPLLEEYCYDDFGTLSNILGSDLVDVNAGRIKAEMFEPSRENDLIGALSFEEMQLEGLASGALSTDAVDGTEENDSEDVSDSPT